MIKGSRYRKVSSHTLYADDIMILCKGYQKYIKFITNFLSRYVSCSGQFWNASKSLIYIGAMNKARHRVFPDILGFSITFPPFL